MRSILVAVALSLTLAAPAFGDDPIPGPAPIDEDVVNAYRLCEANYRTIDSNAAVTSFANNPRYRLEGCDRVLEVYKHEKEVHDKQFIDFVTGHYGDPAAAPPALHGLTPPK